MIKKKKSEIVLIKKSTLEDYTLLNFLNLALDISPCKFYTSRISFNTVVKTLLRDIINFSNSLYLKQIH